MLRTVWAKTEGCRRLYLIDERCDFVEPVKLYLDHLAALEKSPHTLEGYCRHLGRYFSFLRREAVDWRNVRPDDDCPCHGATVCIMLKPRSARTDRTLASRRTTDPATNWLPHLSTLPVIVVTLEDLKKSRSVEGKGWEMYANDLEDQINGMERVLSELNLPGNERPHNRGGQAST